MISLAIVGSVLAVLSVMMYSVQRSRPVMDYQAGTAKFIYNIVWRGFSLLTTFLVPLGILAIAVFNPPRNEHENWIVVGLCAFFIAIGGPLAWETILYALTVSEEGLECRSPWRGRRFVRWDEIQSVSYEQIAMWFTLRARDGYTFHVPILVSGLPVFLDHCEAHLPWEALADAQSGYERVGRRFPIFPGAFAQPSAPFPSPQAFAHPEGPAASADPLESWDNLGKALFQRPALAAAPESRAPSAPPPEPAAWRKPPRSNKTALLVLAVLCGLAAIGVWYWCLTTQTIRLSDFTSVKGTLKSFEEHSSGRRSVYLEFYIEESPLRFRVPTEAYKHSFDGNAFFANARPGHRITFRVDKAQLANPSVPTFDPKPTVYVYAMYDEQKTYSTLEGRQDWQRSNRMWGMVMAIFLTGATIFVGWMYAKERSRARQPAVPGV